MSRAMHRAKRSVVVVVVVAAALFASGCSSSSGGASSASASAEPSARPAKSAAVAAASASASAAPEKPAAPADRTFFEGELPTGVKLTKGASSSNLGFTIKRPDDWQFSGLPGDEMMMISKDGSAAIFCVYPGEFGDEQGVANTLKHAPIKGTDYKQVSKNAQVPIGPAKWSATTGYGTAKVFGEDGDVYWLRADMTLFLVAFKKSASQATRDEAMAIARSMTAPKAAPP